MHRVLGIVVLHVVDAGELGEDGDLVAAGTGGVDDGTGGYGEDVGFAVLGACVSRKDNGTGRVVRGSRGMEKDGEGWNLRAAERGEK